MNRSVYIVAVVSFSLVSLTSNGQSHWSTDFLKTVYSQPNVKTDSLILSQLSGEKYRSPWVRDIDVRLRTNQLSPEIEELRMRFDLMNPSMITADKRYQIAMKNYQDIRSKIRINEYLLEKYELLIGHYQRSLMISNVTVLLTSYQKLLEGSESLSVRAALKLDKEILQLSRELNDLKFKQSILEKEFASKFGDEKSQFSWNQFEMVSEKEIIEEIDYVMEIPMQEVELIINRDNLAAEEYDREQKQSRRSLGFIQPEYEIDAANTFSENLRFQVGIQLPIFDEDRVERRYDEMGLLEELSDSQDDIKELQKVVYGIASSAKYFKEDLVLLASKQEQMSQFSNELATGDRELLIEVMEYQHEISELEIRSRMDLMRVYVQAMSLSGALARPPLRNYLQPQ